MTEKNIVPEAEILDLDDCWRLLGETTLGRLAVIVDGHPDVFPVNFTVDNQTLVFRTGSGTKQQAIEADDIVALEADAVSAEFGFAWSVVVKGRAEETTPTGPAMDEIRRALFPWQGVGQDLLIRITPQAVTGRRFSVTTPMMWHRSVDDASRPGLE
ncbi:pyridoxamine 5'-phosphate oxidase family protein [Pseudarthrobacter sp. AB1]|uniref:pyridoxamine 5'-phosphate oxidase family protein n=1 Tax=Pseudarthrobacter sp. AB1 TaxID=2138309 RepID=UPI00186BAA0E|nr:pyridoxamine 5'-phosphate oxidase family protein [Pseudarthrobacter sp. AB1]MBE4716718.1 flavin-nucleotide-binding protein [Pseudarthrobacter sp. AB1]